jgi:predicted DNA-binding protein
MLTITLPPEVEKRLNGEASRQGLAAEEYVQKLIVEHLPTGNEFASLAELFAEWEAEEGTDDPTEIVRRNQEVEEFKRR